MYGNYIDEPIMTYSGGIYFYVQDHLYSTAALVDASGNVAERYEYDAYGQVHILDANFADDADGASDCNNPYMFTGRRVDFLDGGKLTLQINRHRYYDYYSGRWLTEDPLGYVDGMNLYEYVKSNPLILTDPIGGCGKCLCPESLTVQNIQEVKTPATEYPPKQGFNKFDLVVKGKWIKWDRLEDKGPTFKWVETFNRAPTDPFSRDLAPNEEHDMVQKGHPRFKKFKKMSAPDGCPPVAATYKVHDEPGVHGGLRKMIPYD